MIGADAGFLSYAGGVFTNIKGGKCDVAQADHALLITGYGEETSKDGTVEKYWIGEWCHMDVFSLKSRCREQQINFLLLRASLLTCVYDNIVTF